MLRELERLQGGESESVGSVEGTVELGGQEHFYWEPHTALVVPGERGELLVHYTTQVTTSHRPGLIIRPGAWECPATSVHGAWPPSAQGHRSLQTDRRGFWWQREVSFESLRRK